MPDTNKASRAPVTGTLKEIRVDEIEPNERNPRETFEPTKIEQLAASLETIGLQVPITVYENPSKRKKPYVLLDGERRFRAAKLINWEKIPALIVPLPSPRENAVRMFNIHMLREDWEEIETAWALEHIIDETGETSDRELQELTGLSIDRIKNMRRVLEFPRSLQEKVARGELKYQFLVELDKNVLSKNKVKKRNQKPVVESSTSELRDVFIKKFAEGVETDLVSLRKVGTLFDTAKGEGKVAQRAKAAIVKLVSKPAVTIEEVYEVGAASSVEIDRVLRDMANLPSRIKVVVSGELEENQRKQVEDAIRRLHSHLAELIKKVARS